MKILALVYFLIAGCYDFKDYKEINDPVLKEVSRDSSEKDSLEILNEKEIIDETFIASVRQGDKIIINAYGVRSFSRFEVKNKTTQSYWKERICEHLRPHICLTRKKKGECRFRIRKKVDPATELISFNDLYPLHFSIGSQVYGFPNVKIRNEHISSEIIVTKKMIQSGDDFYLDVFQESLVNEVRVGFLDFTKCKGKGKNGFRTKYSRKSSTLSVVKKNKFVVSLKIERGGNL